MSLNPDEVRRVARLARLAVPEHALADRGRELGAILALVRELDTAATATIAPLAHPLEDARARLREDVVSEDNGRDAAMAQAPETASGLYLVPKVVE